ncbi:hypothetical protein L7F22_043594 [Adiantum nelumboides]|nr:hypothetical protein [Adiantum nelumboides]
MSAEKTLLPSTLFDLKDRVALITGGGSGIGLMQARGLKDAGCKVYLIGRREEVLENAIKVYGFAGYIEGDVTKKEDIEKAVKEMESKEGKIDILICNAGGSGPTHYGADTSFPDHSNDPGPGGKLEKMNPKAYKDEILKNNSFENWNELFMINTHHILFVSIAFLPLLAKGSEEAQERSKKEGKRPSTSTIITTGSISGVVKQGQMHYAYNASKAAANHLTKTLAFEITTTTTAKVRINGILPGVFPSSLTAGGIDEKNQSDLSDKMPTMNVPAGRPGETEDMAQLTQFLAACEYMHGQTVICDGGFTLTAP